MGSWRVRGMCLTASVGVLAPHNDWPLSSAISLSGGRNRPFRSFGGVMLFVASSFSLGSARV